MFDNDQNEGTKHPMKRKEFQAIDGLSGSNAKKPRTIESDDLI